MRKNLKYIILALVAIIFVATFVALWKNSRPKEIRYEQLEATVKDIQKTSVVTGKIIPRDEVNIKPQISGIISELYKEAGENVVEGEIIAKVKVIPEMSSLSSAQSRVRLAEINLKQAQTNYDREKALYDKNLVSLEELLVKLNFADFIRRFERENANIITFGENIEYDNKIAIIKERLADYAREITPKSKEPINNE